MEDIVEIKGRHSDATIFTDRVDEVTIAQVQELCNQEFTEGLDIKIMPDAHAGKGCVIGTTMSIRDKVVPNLVGVDIGCGLLVNFIKIDHTTIDYQRLDDVIRKYVPSGRNVHQPGKRHRFHRMVDDFKFHAPINRDRMLNSVGTLGGGNHFIELNKVDDETVALIIHSGSRHVGVQVATHHQEVAYQELTDNSLERQNLFQSLTSQGRKGDIEKELKKLRKPKVTKDLAYLTGDSLNRYLSDMKKAQEYARINREAMMNTILAHMGWSFVDGFDTVHNYIDFDNMILRKGAISAMEGERVIVPLNMRDGSILATGKGNPEWNMSGPHGAGRVMSRSMAKELVDYDEFNQSMSDVWTTSVSKSTIDESPMVYKPMESIIEYVGESLEINQIIRPLYNFKAS